MEISKQKLLAIVGPTASGKTSLSILLAKRLGGEILSCDSMQIYRGMDIGTAKPTEQEKADVPHHLLDLADADTPFSCAEYVKAASSVIDELSARGSLPVLCGGTGLWLDSLRRGSADAERIPGKTVVREALEAEAEKEGGAAALHARLASVDPESAAAIHPNNTRRVIRALEVYVATGTPKSEWDRRSKERPAAYDIRPIGIRFSDRDRLYARIDARVEKMLEEGLFLETERLLATGALPEGSTAAQAIGYKEFVDALAGRSSMEAAVAQVQQSSRRYAKRQLTWFRRNPRMNWLTRHPGEGAGNLLRPPILLRQAGFGCLPLHGGCGDHGEFQARCSTVYTQSFRSGYPFRDHAAFSGKQGHLCFQRFCLRIQHGTRKLRAPFVRAFR